MFVLSIMLIQALCLAQADNSDQEPIEAKYYDNAKVVRVKFSQGEAFLKRSYDEGFEDAAVNLPIFENDIAGTTDGRLEVYMGRLNYLRLDSDTEVVFDRIPQLQKTNTLLKIKKGGIYLDITNIDFARDIEVQTPDCGVFLLNKGTYRINVTEAGLTEVWVYDGLAEVSGVDFGRNVRDNQKIVMTQGQVREMPFYFQSSGSDAFDQFNRERNTSVGYARYSTARYLQSGYEDYEYELSRSGRWIFSAEYNSNIWIPYNVGATWRPYSHGRWVWNPYYGYVWTSYDSWGYFTHHYGRWHWDPMYQWCWIADYHWSPAWVSWFWDDDYYGWCPLSRWNRPIIVINNRWDRHYNYRNGIPYHSSTAVIIKKQNLTNSHIGKMSLKKNDLNGIGKKAIHYRGLAPQDKQESARIRVINARGKEVVYNKSGFLGSKKYKDIGEGSTVTSVKKEAVYKYAGTKNTDKKVYKYSRPVEKNTVTSRDYSRDNESTKKTTAVKSGYKYDTERTQTTTTKRSGGDNSRTTSTRATTATKSSDKATTVKKRKDSPDYSSYNRSDSTGNAQSSGNTSTGYRTSTPVYKSSYKSSYTSSGRNSSSGSSSTRTPAYKPSSFFKSTVSARVSSGSSSGSSSSSTTRSSSSSSVRSSSGSSSRTSTGSSTTTSKKRK